MSDRPSASLEWSTVLRRIIELSTVERDLRTMVRRVAELVVQTTQADVCFVHVLDNQSGELVLAGATPASFDELAGTIRLRLGEGVAGWVAEQGESVVIDDKWADPRYRYIPALRGEDFDSMVSVPMRRPEGVVVGVLNVHAHRARHFQAGDLPRLTEVAGLLAGIVENAVLYDRLATREHQVQHFAAQTIEMQELERRRIAGDIHDGISQRLISAYYHLDTSACALSGPGEALTELEVTRDLLGDALEEARRAIVGLRPAVLDDLGLAAGITSLTTSIGADVIVTVDVDLDGCSLQPHVETALYRMTQEALQNVAKHAQASSVEVTLGRQAEGVRLTIADDGVGFDPAVAANRASYGLSGIAERASLLGAQVQIQSEPGGGTTITVVVPVP